MLCSVALQLWVHPALPGPRGGGGGGGPGAGAAGNATQLLTGGTGALGLVTARWLGAAGARRLVLASRRGLVLSEAGVASVTFKPDGAEETRSVRLPRVIYGHEGGPEQLELVFCPLPFASTLRGILRARLAAGASSAAYAAFEAECRAAYEDYKETMVALVREHQEQSQQQRRGKAARGAVDVLFL